ncbi:MULTISPECIES: site-specific integrase [Kitasatospora]
MNTAEPTAPRLAGSRRRRREYQLPELTRLRDRAVVTLPIGIAGRASEVSALNAEDLVLEADGLRVTVPSTKDSFGSRRG